MHRTDSESAPEGDHRRHGRLSISAVLGVFKYYGFFANEIDAFLDDIGLPMPLPLLTLALPIGLSFYHLPGDLVLGGREARAARRRPARWTSRST